MVTEEEKRKIEWEHMFKPAIWGVVGTFLASPLISLYLTHFYGGDWMVLTGIFILGGTLFSIVIGLGAGGLDARREEVELDDQWEALEGK